MATTATASATESAPRTIRYRFRKAWRAILFLGIVPFLHPEIIGNLLGLSADQDGIVTFFSGVVTLIPLSTFVEVVTEDLIERLGQFVGGLLHAFFSNAAFFVITMTTLIAAANTSDAARASSLVTLVQSSIAGTIIIDILFILGVSIFIGGMRNGRMQFNAEISNQYAEMLTVAVIALALPTLATKLKISVGLSTVPFVIDGGESSNLSNLTALILIIAYIGYLGWTVFKFRDKAARPQNPEEATAAIRGDEYGLLTPTVARGEEAEQREQLQGLQAADTGKRHAKKVVSVPLTADQAHRARSVRELVNDRLERERTVKKPLTEAEAEERDKKIGIELWEIGILILGTAGIVYISEGMAHALEGGVLNNLFPGREFFVGFVVVPISANLVELSAAVNTAWHDRLETCLAITAGSAIQVALLVAPLLVIVGHVLGVGQMNLIFGLFILAIFALIAYLFQIITVDGETTWLEGLQLISFFAVLAVVAFYANSAGG